MLHFFSDENFHNLLELAEEYQMEQLRHQCVQFLKEVNKNGIKAMKYISTAEWFEITDILEACISELARIPISIFIAMPFIWTLVSFQNPHRMQKYKQTVTKNRK